MQSESVITLGPTETCIIQSRNLRWIVFVLQFKCISLVSFGDRKVKNIIGQAMATNKLPSSRRGSQILCRLPSRSIDEPFQDLISIVRLSKQKTSREKECTPVGEETYGAELTHS